MLSRIKGPAWSRRSGPRAGRQIRSWGATPSNNPQIEYACSGDCTRLASPLDGLLSRLQGRELAEIHVGGPTDQAVSVSPLALERQPFRVLLEARTNTNSEPQAGVLALPPPAPPSRALREGSRRGQRSRRIHLSAQGFLSTTRRTCYAPPIRRCARCDREVLEPAAIDPG